MIIKSFNSIHIMVLIIIPVFLVATYYVFRKRSKKSRTLFIWCLLGLLAATWISVFVSDMINVAEYRQSVLSRLPLHMCSINIVLYSVVFLLRNHKNKRVSTIAFSYAYFVGSPGALLGILMPPSDCINASIFTPNVFVYYLRHGLIFAIPILFVILGFYRPRLKHMLYAVGVLVGLLITSHAINVILTQIGGYRVNYFYTQGDSNVVLHFFWKLIPVPLLYMMPLVIVLIPIFALYYSPFFIQGQKENKHRTRRLDQ